MFSLLDRRFLPCSRDPNALSAQRIFIIITHKSTRSDKSDRMAYNMGMNHAMRLHYPPGVGGSHKSLFVYVRMKTIKSWIYHTQRYGTINWNRCAESRLVFEKWFPFVTGFDGGVLCHGVRVCTTRQGQIVTAYPIE